jgi:hypothetical protein
LGHTSGSSNQSSPNKNNCTEGQWTVQIVPATIQIHKTLGEPDIRVRFVYPNAGVSLPVTANHINRFACHPPGNAATAQVAKQMTRTFLLTDLDRPQPTSDVGVKTREKFRVRAELEVANPTASVTSLAPIGSG